MKPSIEVKNDYDGFFENWAKKLAEELDTQGNQKIEKITVNSGPYRSYGVNYTQEGSSIIHLDFYSAVRNGFGDIGTTPKQLAKQIIEW